MGYSLGDALKLLAEIEGLENTARAKRSTLKQALASIQLPEERAASDERACPRCGVEIRGKTLEEHLADVHGINEIAVAQHLAETYAEKWPEP